MNKIVIYGLTNCGNCKLLIKRLEETKISHVFIACENDSEKCDYLEKLTNCYYYPIVDIEKTDFYKDKIKVKHTIIHLRSEYVELKPKRNLDRDRIGLEVVTLDELYEKILNEIK